jgi:AsmA family protein
MNPVIKTTLRRGCIGIGALLVVVVLALLFMDWNLLKGPIQRIASARSGRSVTIAGPLSVHIWSAAPTMILNGLTVGNPPWESAADRPMLKVDRLTVQVELLPLLKGDVILPRLELARPAVYLHQEKSGRANWTFENNAPTNAPAAKPARLPVVRDLLIQSGKLTLADDIRKLKIDGTVQAHQKASREDPKPFLLEGAGSINDQPFALQVAGGPLVNLDPQHPYPFDIELTAGHIHVSSDGRVLKPFDLGGLDFEVTATGNDLAELFYLTQLALPNTPPFKLHARIARNGLRVAVTDITGTVGSSDLGGTLDVDATRKRPYISGSLVSKRLLLGDLAASLGGKSGSGLEKPGSLDAQPQVAPQAQPKAKAPPADPNARLFPDAHLQVDRVRAMDADVRFSAKSIDAGSVPFQQVALHVKLNDGILSLDPVAFEMPEGHLTGTVRINAQKKIPLVNIDVRVKDIQLDQLKGKAPGASPALTGVMQARAVIEGTGDSVHAVMADANGTFTLILPDGEVKAAFAELTGINVAKGVGLLLKGANDQARIRCGVAQFGIQDGTMHAQTVVFDTQNVVITGKGDIKLGPEQLDLSIKGEPKKIRLARLRSPVEIRGHLLKPSIGIDVGSTLKQGAIAAALGTVLTPFAAMLAFVDPGLAKDQNCAAMLANVESKGPPTPKAQETTSKPQEAAAP